MKFNKSKNELVPIKETLFVIPLGIILNLILIKTLKISNIYFQGLMIVPIFMILTKIYRSFSLKNSGKK